MGFTSRIIRHTALLAIAPLVGAAVSAASAGVAVSSSTIQLHANLTAKQQKPPQVVKAPNAAGRFTATLVINKTRGTMTWKLSFSGLSSAPQKAIITLPATGKEGPMVLQLCGGKTCKTGIGQKSILPVSVAQALSTRAGYVTIQTAKNKQGETSGPIARG